MLYAFFLFFVILKTILSFSNMPKIKKNPEVKKNLKKIQDLKKQIIKLQKEQKKVLADFKKEINKAKKS